jgi:hypothetical protein
MGRLVRTKHSGDILLGIFIVARKVCKNPKNEGQVCRPSKPAVDFETAFCSLLSFCVLVVRVPGYRSRGPGFDSRSY